MPKTIYLPEGCDRSGIHITWTPSAQRLDIGGWYDTVVGIEPTSMSLREFFDLIGITKKNCGKAWEKP